MNFKLSVELVPEKSWGKSLAQLLPKKDWDILRKKTYRRYNWTCLICDAYGVRVNCHEKWEYNDKLKKQILVGLICLCDDCHNIKHWGRTIHALHEGTLTQKYIDKLRQHFCKVNKCTEADMIKHIVEAGDKNMKRGHSRYKIDVSRLKVIMEETDKCLKLRSG